MIDRFLPFLEEVGEQIRGFIRNGSSFLVLSANTPDGLSASLLLIKFFYENDIESHFKFIDMIDESFFQYLFGSPEKSYDHDVYIFLDIGSRFIGKIYDNSRNKNKKIIVIDHHDLVSKNIKLENFYQVNPNIFGINGKREASTSSIVYTILKLYGHVFKGEEILGLSGPISEKQDQKELTGLNKYVLEDLMNKDVIQIKRTIKLSGFLNKPLYKVLSSSLDVYIPGVSGSDEKSIEFLRKLFPDKEIEKLYFNDLKPDEEKKLVNEIIKNRVLNNIMQNERIVGDVYLISKSPYGFKDVGELSFIITSATYLGKHNFLVRYLIRNTGFENLLDIETYFRGRVSSIISDIVRNKANISEKDGIIFIKVPNKERESYTSYVADVLSYNDILDKRYYISYSEYKDYYEVSLRRSKKEGEIPGMVFSLIEKYNGILSGKDNLCGFYIRKSLFDEFKDKLSDILLKFS
ncbi:MAG: hypothetical protein BXU00_01270 [Candidatus Nanoclepta minutus]|uniref:DDH domain-containing protein n=1 Tax=Candidatus Nanoclepta minutus TaxID=1940235 RepID=A0A397WMV4_9ARCH|nr:MAG: hypothetical protein BXU00_01270 [Candidatus Nanoclepta minutus]